jgi:hypothetical protein
MPNMVAPRACDPGAALRNPPLIQRGRATRTIGGRSQGIRSWRDSEGCASTRFAGSGHSRCGWSVRKRAEGESNGGEAGIRTLGRGLKPLQRFSKPPPSASRPPHRAPASIRDNGICVATLDSDCGEASSFVASPSTAKCNQTCVLFVGLPAPSGHARLGTVQGTVDESRTPSVQKTERKRDKATVSLTVAFFTEIAHVMFLSDREHDCLHLSLDGRGIYSSLWKKFLTMFWATFRPSCAPFMFE